MICGIVLAAGRSERMGTQKLLLPLGGKPVIARVVDELLGSSVARVLVIIGREGGRLREVLGGRAVQFVENADPASDMFGSVRCGLHRLPAECEAVLVVLGDQPGISCALVDEMIRHFRRGKSRIIVPACGGHRGHPVLFGAGFRAELLSDCADNGLRGFLDAHAGEVFGVSVSDATALEDMDTPADYQRQERAFANRVTPEPLRPCGRSD
jgi:molybdenum cofactor cytidylyltransferase